MADRPQTRRIALRLEFDDISRDEADLLATRLLAALTNEAVGLGLDTVPDIYPKRKGSPGWLLYVRGDIDAPENLNP